MTVIFIAFARYEVCFSHSILLPHSLIPPRLSLSLSLLLYSLRYEVCFSAEQERRTMPNRIKMLYITPEVLIRRLPYHVTSYHVTSCHVYPYRYHRTYRPVLIPVPSPLPSPSSPHSPPRPFPPPLPLTSFLFSEQRFAKSNGLRDVLRKLDDKGMLSRFVIDEAHCLSQVHTPATP